MATTYSARKRTAKSRTPVIPILSLGMIVGAVAIFVSHLIIFSQQETRLARDVTVAGVDVGGMTQIEAQTKWEQVYGQPIYLYYGDSPIVLEPSTIDFRPNSETMLANALASSDFEASFWVRFFNYLTGQQLGQSASVPLLANYQESRLREILADIAARYDRPPGRPGYDVATLTVYAGNTGTELDIDESVRLIDAALRDPVNRFVQLPTGNSDASRPNLSVLRDLIVHYLDTQGFIYDGDKSVASVFIMDLQTGEEINILSDVAFSAASTIKVPILIDFYRYKDFEPDQNEAFLMANSLLCSRNSSSNLLMKLIGSTDVLAGARDVTSTVQALGARNTFIAAALVEGTAGETFGSTTIPATAPNPNYNTGADPFNQTTAEDMGTLFNLIYDCANYGSGLLTAFPEDFNQLECTQMLELMSGNDLLRLLQGGIPSGTRISHKNGWLTSMVGDAGIVYPPNGRNYLIVVYLWEEAEFQDYERLWPLVEGISRAAWNYFSPEQPLLTARADLPQTAQECEGNYLPPQPSMVDLNDIDGWRTQPGS